MARFVAFFDAIDSQKFIAHLLNPSPLQVLIRFPSNYIYQYDFCCGSIRLIEGTKFYVCNGHFVSMKSITAFPLRTSHPQFYVFSSFPHASSGYVKNGAAVPFYFLFIVLGFPYFEGESIGDSKSS